MKIICIGRNYADHAKELKNDVPTEPVIFLKPDTALLRPGQDFYIPRFSEDVHFEAELVVRINRVGKFIEEKFAHKYYSQVAVGIDFTARDVQQKLKENGLPWEKAKAFDGSAALGKMMDIKKLSKPIHNLHFHLKQNGETRQRGHTADMIFHVDKLISYISQFFTLKIGDLIYTGTPAGVGKVHSGDTLSLFLENDECCKVIVK